VAGKLNLAEEGDAFFIIHSILLNFLTLPLCVAGKLNLAEEGDAFFIIHSILLNFLTLPLQISFYINRSLQQLRLSSARLAGLTSTAAKPGFKEEGECIFYHPFYTSKLSNFATANLILYQSQPSVAASIFCQVCQSHVTCGCQTRLSGGGRNAFFHYAFCTF
jgi:hypothetical protein